MLITSSVIELKKGSFTQVESYINDISGVEIRGVSKNLSRALLIIETEDSEALERISEKLSEHPAIVTVLHHSFNFDGE